MDWLLQTLVSVLLSTLFASAITIRIVSKKVKGGIVMEGNKMIGLSGNAKGIQIGDDGVQNN